MSDYEVRFKAERAAYEAQILQFKQRLEELEVTVKDLTSENERLNALYLERRRENDKLKLRQSNVEQSSNTHETELLRKEIESLRREKFVQIFNSSHNIFF